MPLLKIQTNKELANTKDFLQKASSMLAKILNKPEKFVLIQIEKVDNMIFNASFDEFIYSELKSVNLPEDENESISEAVSSFLTEETGIKSDRIYIEFSNVKGHMWGWNSTTFR
jgi:phenylpyruvate tautomerase PptA (4-oxalocrotonate tautomerase family)